MKRLLIRVSGKVQGVFFRASAKDEADRLGITGIVRNEPDGSVFIDAEGQPEALTLFTHWCRQGPPRARVLTFVTEDVSPKGYVGFKIERV
jgi:acylphosphatase